MDQAIVFEKLVKDSTECIRALCTAWLIVFEEEIADFWGHSRVAHNSLINTLAVWEPMRMIDWLSSRASSRLSMTAWIRLSSQ